MSVMDEKTQLIQYCKEGGSKISSLFAASMDDKLSVLKNWITDRRQHLTESAIDQYDTLRKLANEGVDLAKLQALDKYSTVLEDGRIIQYEFDNLTDPTNLRLWIGETYSDIAVVKQAGEAMVYATVTEQGSELVNKLDDILGEVNDDAAEYLDYAESLLASTKSNVDDSLPLVTAGLQSANATVRELAGMAASTPGDLRANAIVSYLLDGWSQISNNIKTKMSTIDEDAGEFDPAEYNEQKTIAGLSGAWSLLSQASSSIGSILLCIGGPIVKGLGALVVGAGLLMNLLYQKATSQEYMTVNQKVPNYLFANAIRFVMPRPAANVLPLSIISDKIRLSTLSGTLMYNPDADWYKERYNIADTQYSGLWYPVAIGRYITDTQDITRLIPPTYVLRHGLVFKGISNPSSHQDAMEHITIESFYNNMVYSANQHPVELFNADAETASLLANGSCETQFDKYVLDDGTVDNDKVELCTRAQIFRSILMKCFDTAWLSMQNYSVASLTVKSDTPTKFRLLSPYTVRSNHHSYPDKSLSALGHGLIGGSLNDTSGIDNYFIDVAMKVQKAITVKESLDFTKKALQFISDDLPASLASNGLYPISPDCLTSAHVPTWVELGRLLSQDMVFAKHPVSYSAKPVWSEICDKYDEYRMGTGQEDLNGFKTFLKDYSLFELILIQLCVGAANIYNQSYERNNLVTLTPPPGGSIRLFGITFTQLSQGWLQVCASNIGTYGAESYPYRDPFTSSSDSPEVIDDPAITPPKFARGTLLAIVIVAAGVLLAATIAAIGIKRAFRNHQRAKLVEREEAASKAQKKLAEMDKTDPGYKDAVKEYVKSQRKFQRYAGRIGYSSNSIGSYNSTGSIPVPDMSEKMTEVVESAYASGADYLSGLYGDATPAVTVDDLDLSEVTDALDGQSTQLDGIETLTTDFQSNMNYRLGNLQYDVDQLRVAATNIGKDVSDIRDKDIPSLADDAHTTQNLALAAAQAAYDLIEDVTGSKPH